MLSKIKQFFFPYRKFTLLQIKYYELEANRRGVSVTHVLCEMIKKENDDAR